MFVDFKAFVSNTSETVAEVLDFIGADPDAYDFKTLPAGMKVTPSLVSLYDSPDGFLD